MIIVMIITSIIITMIIDIESSALYTYYVQKRFMKNGHGLDE